MRLAIIGAGVAGLAAARALRASRPDIAITIFEKSRGLGGRAATRRVAGCTFDHGAQYVKAPTPELERLVTQELAPAPTDIAPPVWAFDGAGAVREGDPQLNAEAKWTYASGITALAKALGQGLEVRAGVRVASLEQSPGGYRLRDAEDATLAEADAVLLTPPGPQTAELVGASTLDAGVKNGLLAELGRSEYRRCLALTFAYGKRPDVSYYALVNTDRRHPVSWLALEHLKPTRAPEGVGLLVAQMAHPWSVEHYDEAQAGTFERVAEAPLFVREAHELSAALLGQKLGEPLWANLQRWRYSLPNSVCDFDILNGTGSGLFFAGDYTAGQGRVHLAIEQGWKVASAIAALRT